MGKTLIPWGEVVMGLFEYITSFNRRLAFPWMSTIGLCLTGYKLNEVYLSPQKHLELAMAMDREFGADFVYPLDNGAILVETLGLPLLKSDYDFPSTLDNPVKTLARLAQLPVINPNKDGIIPNYLEALRLISGHSDKPLAVSVRGHFTLAVELVGVTDFARAIIRNPGFVEEVLNYTGRLVSDYVCAVADAGVRLLCVSEPTAVILSPERFEKMVGDHLRAIFNRLPEDLWRILHICGDTNYLLPQILKCGVDGLSLDQIMDFPQVAARLPPDVVLIGNLDPVHVLRELDAVQVREHTLELLRSMRGYPNYLFSFGCDCTPDTPFENLKAALLAVQTEMF